MFIIDIMNKHTVTIVRIGIGIIVGDSSNCRVIVDIKVSIKVSVLTETIKSYMYFKKKKVINLYNLH